MRSKVIEIDGIFCLVDEHDDDFVVPKRKREEFGVVTM
jgi:hypothetical protein